MKIAGHKGVCMFNERKAAQMAAFFLRQTSNNRMPHLKLMKLLYLADREAVRAFGRHLSGDRWVSMDHGPVLSQTLNLMAGDVESLPGGWEDWISDKEDHEVALRKPQCADALDELAPAEIDVLKSVWDMFGWMDKWQIRDWTHRNCAEWSYPHHSSTPILYEDVARAVGFSDSSSRELAEQYQAEKTIDRLFATL